MDEQFEQKNHSSNFSMLILFLILAALYHFIDNVYVGMILYTVISYIIVEFFADSIGNDLIKLAAIIILPFVFNNFSLAYHLFLLGLLLQTMGFDQNKGYDLSEIRRRYGVLFNFAGIALLLVGFGMGVYNVFFK